MTERQAIACLGAGRMARGIAVVFAYAGHRVTVVDVKGRDAAGHAQAAAEVLGEVRATLATLAGFGLFAPAAVDGIAARVAVLREAQAHEALRDAAVIFEGVPEVLDLKREVIARISKLAGPEPIIASTTSTILVDDLSSAVEHPKRFLNAHWLNPAFLIPLVELSPGARTDAGVTQKLKSLLEGIGKVPVVCAARPGYIVPRIQVVALNEAARMVEEGVASAEDIDKAIKYGFGMRYANLGMLEFIDFGGGDILYYASRYLTQALGDERYAAPEIIERNMREGHVGLKTGKGFLDYSTLDIEAYRAGRLTALADMLGFMGLIRPPVLPE
jgi:3-hydroxybutyryl-CoA dehydrogenase